MAKQRKIDSGFEKLGLPTAQRHAFLCVGPDCCRAAEGEAAWKALKSRLKDEEVPIMRTKAACFRVCHGGPWLVVYPEGIWYGEVTADRIDRIVSEHLIKGRPVQEWVVRAHALGGRPMMAGGARPAAS